jgi:cardiolipin synthase
MMTAHGHAPYPLAAAVFAAAFLAAKGHTLKHLKLHAEMLLADSKRAIVGSINLAPGSFDARRELAIETDDHHAVR